jgi:hypothetical protein
MAHQVHYSYITPFTVLEQALAAKKASMSAITARIAANKDETERFRDAATRAELRFYKYGRSLTQSPSFISTGRY